MNILKLAEDVSILSRDTGCLKHRDSECKELSNLQVVQSSIQNAIFNSAVQIIWVS